MLKANTIIKYIPVNNDGDCWDEIPVEHYNLDDTIFNVQTVYPNSSQSMRYLAVDDDVIVGVIYWSIGFNDCPFDFTVFVKEGYRRIGIGEFLIKFAIEAWDEEYEARGWDFKPMFCNDDCKEMTRKLMNDMGFGGSFNAA